MLHRITNILQRSLSIPGTKLTNTQYRGLFQFINYFQQSKWNCFRSPFALSTRSIVSCTRVGVPGKPKNNLLSYRANFYNYFNSYFKRWYTSSAGIFHTKTSLRTPKNPFFTRRKTYFSSPLTRKQFRAYSTSNNAPKGPHNPDKNSSFGLYLFAAAVLMVAAGYAFVPFYRIFCQITGIGGTTQKAPTSKSYDVVTSREIRINFSSSVNSRLPWKFVPLQDHVEVFPGETVLVFYEATNQSDTPLIGVATYNVTPAQAGKYFEKIECFCFDEQRIMPNETIYMPVLFRLNPELTKSWTMDDVNDILLSYTFFLSNDQNVFWDDSENINNNTQQQIEQQQEQVKTQ